MRSPRSPKRSPRPPAGTGTSRAGQLIYEPYYGLREKPFSLSTDPRFLYRSGAHSPVLQDLPAAIRRREGLMVLTGDIGMGKTTLCRSVLSHSIARRSPPSSPIRSSPAKTC